jgi:CDP-diacylglycerol--glycerol-3-phosphate 3-phosphatidyltransferase
VADGALSASVAVYLLRHAHAKPVAPLWAIVAGVTVVVTGALVPYVKARAEAGGIVVSGGLMERAERLILMAAGTTCAAFGRMPRLYGLLRYLPCWAPMTVFQRVNLVRKGVRAA